MLRPHAVLALLAGVIALASPAGAQRAPTIRPNDRVRVWRAPSDLSLDGWLVALDSSGAGSIVVRRPATVGADGAARQLVDTLPLTAVQRVEVYRATRVPGRAGRGALIGALVGGGGGLAAGKALERDCQSTRGDDCGLAPPVITGVGLVLGTVIGVAVGMQKVGSWQTIQSPRRVGVLPTRRGMALRIGF